MPITREEFDVMYRRNEANKARKMIPTHTQETRVATTDFRVVEPSKGVRVRQDSKPLLNKLELNFYAWLLARYPGVNIHCQEWRVKISNGAWFKVDFCALIEGVWTAWECKGPREGKNVARGMLALKCACSKFPEVKWILVWRESGAWKQQEILP